MRPLVSVIFPCYNAEKYLSLSLESILNQDYSNIEVICINDGSTDGTGRLLEEFQTADTRIIVITNPRNLGLIATLNHGLELASGEFFARMDADDYCPPDRIVKQMEYISRFPGYQLVSSGYHYFTGDGRRLEYVAPLGTFPLSLRFVSLFSTPLTHASVLGKIGLVKDRSYLYDKNYPHSEDYELFSRLAWQGVSMGNLRESLYWVRLNPESVSVVHNRVQIASHLSITKRNLLAFGISEDRLSESVLKAVSNRIDAPASLNDLRDAFRILNECYGKYLRSSGLHSGERREISAYLRLQKLNILIQANKAAFARGGLRGAGFFLHSLQHLGILQLGMIGRKLFVYFRFRIRTSA